MPATAPPPTKPSQTLAPNASQTPKAGGLVQQTAIALKKVIESVYTDGITAILKTDMGEDGSITGKFADGPQVYNFTLTANDKLQYNEAEATGERSDAYLLGYTVDSGMALRGQRLDAPSQAPGQTSTRTVKCEKGKRCGGSCVAKGLMCSVALSGEAKQVAQQVRSAIGQIKGAKPTGTVQAPNEKAAALTPADIKRYYSFTVDEYGQEEKRTQYKPANNKHLSERPEGYYSKQWTVDAEADAVSEAINVLNDDGLLKKDSRLSDHPKEVAKFINEWRAGAAEDQSQLKSAIAQGDKAKGEIATAIKPSASKVASSVNAKNIASVAGAILLSRVVSKTEALGNKTIDKGIDAVFNAVGSTLDKLASKFKGNPEKEKQVAEVKDKLQSLYETPPDSLDEKSIDQVRQQLEKLYQRSDALSTGVVSRRLDAIAERLDKACGESFIAENKECHIGQGSGQGSTEKPSASRKSGSGWRKAATTMAALVGVSAAAYLVTRANYRSGFEKSADMAKARAKEIDAPVVKARQHTIIFGVGGMAYADESPAVISGERIVTSAKMAFSRDKGKDLKLVPVSNAADNVPSDRTRGTGLEQNQDVAELYYRSLQQGRNLAAVELAAQVLAYAEKNPDKQLVMMGHSRGGVVVHEAQEILRRANPELEPRLKSVNFGTQYGGITEKFGESHTIGSPQDPFTSRMPTRDLKSFDDVQGHSQGAYFGNPAVKQFVSDLIYRDVKLPEESQEAAATKQPQKKQSKQDAYYTALIETALQTAYRRDSEQPEAVAAARALVRNAIATVFKSIASVRSVAADGQTLTGIFGDRAGKFYQFTINQAGDSIRYQQIQKLQRDQASRTDADSDQCQKGTPCGLSCVPAGSQCETELSGSTQALVKLAHKTLETEQIPSRAEIAQVAGAMAREALRNPIKFIREGSQREAAVRQVLKQRGVDAPTRIQTAKIGVSRGAAAIKTYMAENPEAVRELSVAATGFIGSTVGGAVAGPVGGIAGEVGTVLVSRKAISDYQALQAARKKLKHDEAFQAAGRLQKLKMLRKASIEELKAMDLNEGRAGDLAGAIMGGSAGSIAGAAIGGLAGPIAGIATGVSSAITAQKTYAKVKEGKALGAALQESAQEVAAAPGQAIAAGNERENRNRRKAKPQIQQGKIVAKLAGLY